MVSKEKIKELALLAGFEFSHEGEDYICFDYKNELINPYRVLFNLNPIISSIGVMETENDVLVKLFEELLRIGRMQVRQELVKIISIFNTD